MEREGNRNRALHIVLDEQSKQKNEGVSSPERIALQYQLATEACQARANQTGLKDEIAAGYHYEKPTLKQTSRRESDDLTAATSSSSLCLLDDDDRYDIILSSSDESRCEELVLPPLALGLDLDS